MEDFKIYLAGACKGLPDLGTQWRKEVADTIGIYNELFEPHIVVYDPTQYFPRGSNEAICDKQVKNFYLNYLINKSDLVLVNLNNTQNSVGTGQELQYAVDNYKPIIGFGYENVYEWLMLDCDVFFETQKEAIDYILDFYLR